MHNDEDWMQQALTLAQHAANLDEVPVGALVVQDDTVIGQGWNCPISQSDPSAHAEVQALRDAARHLGNYRLPQATLYVTLEPCAMCAGAIIHARIARVVFGAYDAKTGMVHSLQQLLDDKRLNHQATWQGGVLAQASAQLLQDFFRKKR